MPTVPNLLSSGWLTNDAGRGLGEAVALEDLDAGGVEPLRDVAVERGGTGDEEADVPAEAVTDLGEDELVEEAVLDLEAERHRLALALAALDLEADLEGLLEDLLLGTALGGLHGDDPAVGLLEDARSRTHERRLHHAQVVDDLLDAAVDRRGEAAAPSGSTCSTLPKEWAIGSQRNSQVVGAEDALRADRLALVDPRGVAQPHALGPAGGAGGVDQGGQLVGTDRLRRRTHDVGLLGEPLRAQRGEVLEGDDPVAVGRAVEGDRPS